MFHIFQDESRRRYVDGVAAELKLISRLFLLCFSDVVPGDQGHRRVNRREIEDACTEGWAVGSFEPSGYEVRLVLKDIRFNEGRPKTKFVVARKVDG